MRFGDYLAQTIKQAGMSQREFAQLVRTPQQNMNEIVLGRRGPPVRKLDQWAQVLAAHIQRERFLVLGWLEHAPDQLRDAVLETPGALERLEKTLKRSKPKPNSRS